MHHIRSPWCRTVIVLAAACVLQACGPRWQQVTSNEDRFSVLMPAEPETRVSDAEYGGTRLSMRSFVAEYNSPYWGGLLAARVSTAPIAPVKAAVVRQQMTSELEKLCDGAAVTKRELSEAQHRAVEIHCIDGDVAIWGRVVVSDGRAYKVGVIGPRRKVDPSLGQYFLDSFKLMPAPQ